MSSVISNFNYNHKTGILTWKVRAANCVKIGEEAGFKHGMEGYRCVCVNRKCYQVHRLCWEIENGDIPEGMEIDHINGVRDDNRIDNLRLVTKKENLKNKGMYKSNSSGFTGVSYDKSQDVWVSKISGKLIGKYKSIVDAVESRIVSEVSMKYHINNGGKIR